jgi:hypothetical protein
MRQEKKNALLAKDAALSERNAANAERDAAIQQRDVAHAERDAAYHERDGARFDRDFAYMEKDAAVANLLAQVDTLKTERDALKKEMQAAIAKARATAAQREALEAEKKTLLARNEALRMERDESAAKLSTLAAKKDQDKASDAGNREKQAQAKESASVIEKMLLKAQKHTAAQNQNKLDLIVSEEKVKPLYTPPKAPKTARTNAAKTQTHKESAPSEPTKDQKKRDSGKDKTAASDKTDKTQQEAKIKDDTSKNSSRDKRPAAGTSKADKPKVLDLASLLVLMRPLKDTWKREGLNKPTMSMLKTAENNSSNKRRSLPPLREDLPLSDSHIASPHVERAEDLDSDKGYEYADVGVGKQQKPQASTDDDKKDMHNTKLKEWHDHMAQDTLLYTEHTDDDNADYKVDAKESESEETQTNVPKIKDKVSVQKDQRYLNVAGKSKIGAYLCACMLYLCVRACVSIPETKTKLTV